MSVINQLLIDLDKRRASGAERKTLPDHVRVMPQATGGARAAWIAGLGLVLGVAALLAAWVVLRGSDGMPQRAVPAVSPPPVTANAVAVEPADVAAPGPERQLAARLSFELSRLPDTLPEPEAHRPNGPAIPAARVIGMPSEDARAVPAATSRIETKPLVAATPAKQPVNGAARTVPAVPEAPRIAIDKRVREPAPRELAETEYRKATALLHQGRLVEAREGFEAALARHPAHHRARQALLGLLVEAGRGAEAERVMHDGLQIAPHQIGFAMALARLQVDRGDALAAIGTLQDFLTHGQVNGDYLAFLAGLLQRERRHGEAIEHFNAALRLRPDSGVWLLGIGMSLQALNRDAEAREAFQRARTSPALNADLQAFADQRLRQLQ